MLKFMVMREMKMKAMTRLLITPNRLAKLECLILNVGEGMGKWEPTHHWWESRLV